MALNVLPAGQGAGPVAGVVGRKLGAPVVEKTLEAVAPRLTSKVAIQSKKTAPQGIRGTISRIPEAREKAVAKVMEGIFDGGKTFSENALRVEQAISQKAEALKQALVSRNTPYIFKELQSDFKKIDIPHFIKTSDAVAQKRADSIIRKFMEFSKNRKGSLDELLEARKEFDTWIKREYPRVFDESGNAINQLVKNVRTAANDFIEKRAADVGVKASLKEQNLLFDALDTLNEKAVLGDLKKAGEIGSTYMSRFAERHPTTIGAVKTGLAGLIPGGVAGYLTSRMMDR